MESSTGVVVVGRRTEIDTRQPFRSVKEAVQLFGERVLVGEIYAKQLKEIRAVSNENKDGQSKNIGVLQTQLEETKQSLEKAREEAKFKAHCINSLKEELEQAKRELQRLKAREYDHKHNSMRDFLNDPETEDLKFMANTTMREREMIMKTQAEEAKEYLFQKKRNVKFASPPSLTRVIVSNEETLERPPSVKKKPLLAPLLGWILSKRKGSQEGEE
ncbi:WEB family protein [Tripterygium wilfordii]|uniref:WEB family protein n=1 Tax=Tripterygium wilfordii TaxID=458696 RepID=A0A7J7E356_TRIWF|nr:WEB family protein At3g51220-like [Tripterygium wilfordii]KAF5753038.1 WEB family protein [Tripterygium wilfordii]